MKEKILKILQDCNGYISGEELSGIFGISRSAVWKYIKALRNEGYVIDSVTNKGYCLKSSTNVLNAVEFEKGLDTSILGREIIFLPTVDSTNEEIKRRAHNGGSHGLVAVAETQTIGKGRLGRAWSSPASTGLWFSILLRPDISPAHIAGITLAAGLAVCEAVRSFTGCNALIKWPNDIIIGKKKLCGILTEMTAEADRIDYAVLGIGVNVNNKSFPPDIEEKATSLMIETGVEVSRVKLLQKILHELEIYLDEYLLNTQHSIAVQYRNLCATIGKTIKTVRNGISLTGTAEDITNAGELIVRLTDGSIITVSSGEVTVQGIY